MAADFSAARKASRCGVSFGRLRFKVSQSSGDRVETMAASVVFVERARVWRSSQNARCCAAGLQSIALAARSPFPALVMSASTNESREGAGGPDDGVTVDIVVNFRLMIE